MSRYREMPKNVRRYLWLIAPSFLTTLASAPWQQETVQEQLVFGHASFVALFVGIGIFVLLIFACFIWLAAWRRKNWARWFLLLTFLASLPFGFSNSSLVAIVLEAVSYAIEAVALYFLFSGDANPWFRSASGA